MLLRDAKLCTVTVFGISFVVENRQYGISLLINFLFLNRNLQAYVIMLICGEKRHSSYDVDLLYEMI